MKIFTTFVAFAILSSCAMAPLSNDVTARTNGRGEMSLEFGANGHLEVPYFRLGYGLLERIDIGLLYEMNAVIQTAGLWTKIGLLKSDMGLSLALIGSYGSSGNDADYYYLGSIASMKFQMIEIFGLIRYNHLEAGKTTDLEFDDLFTIPIGTPEFDFWMYTAGMNIWFANWFGINANATLFSGDLDPSDGVIMLGGGLLFRF